MLTVEGYKYSQERRQNGRARVHLPGARAFWPGRTRARVYLPGARPFRRERRQNGRARVYLPGARAFWPERTRARLSAGRPGLFGPE